MKLFFLFLCFIIVIKFLSIKINISDFILTNNIKLYNNKFKIKLEIYIFKKIKIFSIDLNNRKFKNKYLNNRLQKSNIKKLLKLLKIIINKSEKFEIEKFSLNGQIGLANIFATIYTITFLSSIISFFIPKYIKKIKKNNYQFSLTPNYNNSINYYIEINCIFIIKIVNIIYILKKFKEAEYGTSNRKSYGYGYE